MYLLSFLSNGLSVSFQASAAARANCLSRSRRRLHENVLGSRDSSVMLRMLMSAR